MRHSPVEDVVAIGGEDGIVRLYEVLEDTTDCCLQYSKCFERQESRILSIAWHPRGKVTEKLIKTSIAVFFSNCVHPV